MGAECRPMFLFYNPSRNKWDDWLRPHARVKSLAQTGADASTLLSLPTTLAFTTYLPPEAV